jgi:hypothetical protein
MKKKLESFSTVAWRGLLCILYSWQAEMLALWRKIGVRKASDSCVNLEILVLLVCRIVIRVANIERGIRRQHIKPTFGKMLLHKFGHIHL